MFLKISVLCLFALFGVVQINGHTYHTGQCPIVEPMPGLDMRQVRKNKI